MAEQAPLDAATLRHVAKLLEDRLQAVVTYGAGGCPSCHDAELRGAITTLKRLQEPPAPPEVVQAQWPERRRRGG